MRAVQRQVDCMNIQHSPLSLHDASVLRQRGSALIFLMVLLLGVAMLAMLANRGAILENVASRSSRDQIIARSAAESALADAANAIGSQTASVFASNAKAAARTQLGGCTYGGSLTAGTPDATGKQSVGGSSTPGIMDFRACTSQTKAWWQELTLSEFETYSASIGDITGDSTSATILAATGTKVRSYKQARVIVEPLAYTPSGGNASAETGSAEYIFRLTAVGYGPTADSVVMLQETWRTQD